MRQRSHPDFCFRGSIARPARAPANASPRPRGSSTHDSGPPWVATPSAQSSSISSSMPVYPGAFQKHDYPFAAHRRSYARRTGAERGFATAKDPATNDITRGWCRLMGLAPLMLFTTTLLIVRNQRILAAWNARQEETQRRAARGLPPKTRKRRRKALASLSAPP